MLRTRARSAPSMVGQDDMGTRCSRKPERGVVGVGGSPALHSNKWRLQNGRTYHHTLAQAGVGNVPQRRAQVMSKQEALTELNRALQTATDTGLLDDLAVQIHPD